MTRKTPHGVRFFAGLSIAFLAAAAVLPQARRNALVRLLRRQSPQLVGAHWHQFSDQPTSGRFDGEFLQVGWTDICDRPYPETVRVLRALDLYATRMRQPQ